VRGGINAQRQEEGGTENEKVSAGKEVITPMEEKDRFKKSQEAEKKRYRFEMKYSKQLEEARLRAGSQAAVKELDQAHLPC